MDTPCSANSAHIGPLFSSVSERSSCYASKVSVLLVQAIDVWEIANFLAPRSSVVEEKRNESYHNSFPLLRWNRMKETEIKEK